MMERCPCPLCNVDLPKGSPYRGGEFAVVRCGSCDAWYLSPRLREEAIRQSYASQAYFEGGSNGYASYAGQERSLRATFRKLLEEMSGHGMTGGAVLDVGCGYGFFLDEAGSHFQYRVGTDFSAEAVRRAGGRADAVYCGGTDSIPPNVLFDCIVALHVIEHVYAPHGFVQTLLERLRPGGWLVLATPDMGSFWRFLMRRRWPSFKYPEHVVFYDSRSLRSLFRDVEGVAAVRSIAYPHAFPLADIGGKFGIRIPEVLHGVHLWIPGTTIALAAQKTVEQSASSFESAQLLTSYSPDDRVVE